jgi:hypothetical protein
VTISFPSDFREDSQGEGNAVEKPFSGACIAAVAILAPPHCLGYLPKTMHEGIQ